MVKMTEDEHLAVEMLHGAIDKGLPSNMAFNAVRMAATPLERVALDLATLIQDPIERELMVGGHIGAIWARLCLKAYVQRKAERAGK